MEIRIIIVQLRLGEEAQANGTAYILREIKRVANGIVPKCIEIIVSLSVCPPRCQGVCRLPYRLPLALYHQVERLADTSP